MDNQKPITDAFSEQNTALEDFFKQCQNNFTNINNQVKTIQDSLLAFKNDIDSDLKQIEMDLEKNRSVISRWFDGSNTKLWKEQISQKRMVLVDSVKKINDNLTQFSQELSRHKDEFDTATSQFSINYKTLENQLKAACTNCVATSQQGDLTIGMNPAVQNFQDALQRAVEALNTAQQGILQRKVLYELDKSINNIMQ